MSKAPVLFVSHGAPTFALEPGMAGPKLTEFGKHLKDVKAILIVSPHWETPQVEVTTGETFATIHDFYGFPKALYELQYPAKGSPFFAQQVIQLLSNGGIEARPNTDRGLDHGAWVPLRYLVPDASLPVFQVSMPAGLDVAGAYQLGRLLAPLREQGLKILASGSLTHNLGEFRLGLDAPQSYVTEFVNWVKEALADNDDDRMLAYRETAPHATRAHPGDDHFLPLLVALGAHDNQDAFSVIEGGVTYGFLSMDSFVWQ